MPRGEGDVARNACFKGITLPTLFVAGTEDAVCKRAALDDIVGAYGGQKLCRIVAIEGEDHMLGGVGQRGITIKRIVAFVAASRSR